MNPRPNPRLLALTDDMSHDQLVQFLHKLYHRDPHFMAALKRFRRDNGLPVEDGE